jgi:hypothetical protein
MMPRIKTPEHLLSDAEKKRQARNQRYASRKKIRLSRQIEDVSDSTASPSFLPPVLKPETEIGEITVLNPPLKNGRGGYIRRQQTDDLLQTPLRLVLDADSTDERQSVLNPNLCPICNEGDKKEEVPMRHLSSIGVQADSGKGGPDVELSKSQLSSEWRCFEKILSSPSIFFSSIAILAITCLLTYFQAAAYLHEGFGVISYPIAIICEVCLAILAVFYSLGHNQKTAILLFVGMFVYSLGTMSYDLRSSQEKEVTSHEQGSEKQILIESSLKSAQASLAIAQEKKESGNISRHTKTVEDLTTLVTKGTKSEIKSGLITYKYDGLIYLRALLMMINGFLIHFSIRSSTRRKQLHGV